MSTANTLRNMSLVWAMLQDGFENGELEFDYVDSVFTISGKKYLVEAKSQYYKDKKMYNATLNSTDVSTGYAQLKYRSKYSDNGIVAINRSFSHGSPAISAIDYTLFKMGNLDIVSLNHKSGYIAKAEALGMSNQKDLSELSVLRLPGEDGENIRKGLAMYAVNALKKRNVSFDSDLIYDLVNAMDKILEDISESKDNEIDVSAINQWFVFRAEHEGVSSMKFNASAQSLFEDEASFKRAKNEWNDSKNLKGTINPDFVLQSVSPADLLTNIKGMVEGLNDSQIDHIKIAYLLKEA